MFNYNNKRFSPKSNTENGETSAETIFVYKQQGNILTSEYAGGKIVVGHLIGLVDEFGNINMRYHQVNTNGEIRLAFVNQLLKCYQMAKFVYTNIGNGHLAIYQKVIQY